MNATNVSWHMNLLAAKRDWEIRGDKQRGDADPACAAGASPASLPASGRTHMNVVIGLRFIPPGFMSYQFLVRPDNKSLAKSVRPGKISRLYYRLKNSSISSSCSIVGIGTSIIAGCFSQSSSNSCSPAPTNTICISHR